MDLTVHDLPLSVHRTVHYAPLLPSSNTCTSHPHFYDCILCLHVVQTATPFLLPSHGCALHTINIYSVFTYRTSSTCNTFWKYTHGTNLVFIKYCVFSFKCCNFSELCQFCCSAGVLTPRENRERPEFGIYLKSSDKKTQYLKNTLYKTYLQHWAAAPCRHLPFQTCPSGHFAYKDLQGSNNLHWQS